MQIEHLNTQQKKILLKLSPLAVAVRTAVIGLSVAHGVSHAATMTVDSLLDNGDGNKCTLREAVVSINQGSPENGCPIASDFGVDDQIDFAGGITNADMITLTGGQLTVTKSVRISGPASDWTAGYFPLTISAISGNRVFDIFAGGNPTAPSVQISDLTITGASGSVYGAGVFVNGGSSLELSNSVIKGNTSTVGGGGVDVRNSSAATIDKVLLESNNGTNGGGISLSSNSAVFLSKSTLANNHASANGGGIAIASGSYSKMSSNTFVSNTATFEGGGIHSEQSSLDISNTTISSNLALNAIGGIGGGLFIGNGSQTASLSHMTITGNSASGAVGGIYLDGVSGFDLSNSIVAGNSSNVSAEIEDSNGQSTIVSNNNVLGDSRKTNVESFTNFPFDTSDITATQDGTNPAALRSILGVLSYNGGPSQTHALMVGSPAIDAADSVDCANSPVNNEDQRAVQRPIANGCDIGALEASLPATISVNTIDDMSGTQACSLRDAIISSNTNAAVAGCSAGSDLITNIEFDGSVFASSPSYTYLYLNGPLPTINSPTSIFGGGIDNLIVYAQQTGRVFAVNATTASFSDLRISGGLASRGAGIYAYAGSTINLNKASVTYNKADYGGAIYLKDNSVLNVFDSRVNYNGANQKGGGIFIASSNIGNQGASGSLNIERSILKGNYAEFDGGGIFVSDTDSAMLSNTTLTSNNARRGGGILGLSSSTSLINSTVTGNTAAVQGGGIISGSAKFSIVNSIVAGNKSIDGAEISHYSSGTTITSQNSLLGDDRYTNAQAFSSVVMPSASDITATSDGTNPNALSDILGMASYNGGLTATHRLLENSPAIDAGDATVCSVSSINNVDQRGRSRIANGLSCDLGAFEVALNTATILVDTKSDSTGGPDCSLRDAITSANQGTATGGCTLGGDLNSAIVFDDTVFPANAAHTILLSGELPGVRSNLSITGQGSEHLTLDANKNGSVLSLYSSSSTLENLSFTGGSVFRYGAGLIVSEDSDVTLNNCTVTGNTVTGGFGGGGINLIASALSLISTTVSNNSAFLEGGGVYARDSSVSLINSTVSNNTAYGFETFSSTPTGSGGGLHLRGSLLEVFGSTISGNSARQGGGVRAQSSSNVNLANSSVSGNSVSESGGGVVVESASQTIILNSTISANVADDEGGGILAKDPSTVNLLNALVAGNSAATFAEIDAGDPNVLFSSSFSLIGDSRYNSSDAFGSIALSINDITATNDGTEPTALASIIEPLADNGGATETHNLVIDSPAIDAGSNILCTTLAVDNKDQRERRRPKGPGCDIGSVEFEAPSSMYVVPLPNGKVVVFEL